MASSGAVDASGSGPHRFSLPSKCNQGQVIPGFVLGAGCDIVGVDLELHDGLELRERFNAKPDGSLARLTPETANGYVGFTIKIPISEAAIVSPRAGAVIECRVHGTTTHEWEGRAYRPMVKLDSQPSEITLQKRDDRWQASVRAVLVNVGASTAVVSAGALDGSELEIEASGAFQTFIRGFAKDLVGRLPNLVNLYPAYVHLLERLPALLTFDQKTQQMDRISEIDEYLSELTDAMANDGPFENDLGNAVTWAFQANWKTTNMAEQFVEYMKSIAGTKVILRNPFDVVVIGPEAKSLRMRLYLADMAASKYTPIEIEPISLKAAETVELPIYKLLQFR